MMDNPSPLFGCFEPLRIFSGTLTPYEQHLPYFWVSAPSGCFLVWPVVNLESIALLVQKLLRSMHTHNFFILKHKILNDILNLCNCERPVESLVRAAFLHAQGLQFESSISYGSPENTGYLLGASVLK